MTRRAALTVLQALLAMGVSATAQFPQLPVRDTPAQPTTGAGVISGITTTDGAMPQPLRKVRVTLNAVNRATPGRTDTTDDAGRFVFRDLPSGRFTLSASRPGYLTTNYGANRPEHTGTPIALSDGQQVTGIVLRIAPGGVISGTVRDQSGRPLPNASVRVLRYGYSGVSAERSLGLQSLGGLATTDDRGTYRAWGLSPGEYAVMVNAPVMGGRAGRAAPGLEDMRRLTAADVERALFAARNSGAGRFNQVQAPPPPPSAPETYAPTFYPRAIDVGSSTPITLGASEERDGIDIDVQLVPTARVAGGARFPAGVQSQPVTLTLTPAGDQIAVQGGPLAIPASTLDREGRFAFAGIGPGHYTLIAKTGVPGARPGEASGPAWWAMADVTVDGRDLDLALDMQPPMRVTGRLVFDGASAAPQNLTSIHIFLVPPGAGGNLSAGPPGGQVDEQGHFEFTAVTPGTYRPLGLPGLAGAGTSPASWAIKSSRVNGRDAYDVPIEIKPNENIQWVVTYGDQPTEVTGTLQDRSGRAATDYFVLVFPIERSLWTPGSPRVRNARPATDGQFLFRGLPPDQYFIAALTDLENGEWNDPSFLASLVASSIRITLVEGQKVTQDLRLVGR